jgi:hypothetical protein
MGTDPAGMTLEPVEATIAALSYAVHLIAEDKDMEQHFHALGDVGWQRVSERLAEIRDELEQNMKNLADVWDIDLDALLNAAAG